MQTHGRWLNEESLVTLMAETEGILNFWSLTTDNISDRTSSLSLSPNLLSMKSKIILPPPGDFSRPDLYSCRRCRRVQQTLNEFDCRWRKGFLQSLQKRKTWNNTEKNLEVGDIVIFQEANTIRNDWQMSEVVETYCDEKGFVRSVKLKIGSVDQASRSIESWVTSWKWRIWWKPARIPAREPRVKCNVISKYHVS